MNLTFSQRMKYNFDMENIDIHSFTTSPKSKLEEPVLKYLLGNPHDITFSPPQCEPRAVCNHMEIELKLTAPFLQPIFTDKFVELEIKLTGKI